MTKPIRKLMLDRVDVDVDALATRAVQNWIHEEQFLLWFRTTWMATRIQRWCRRELQR